MTTAITTSGLRRSFRTQPVLQGVDLAVAPGEIYGLLGPNGAGKTTLVRILATLLPPDGGTAAVLGHDVVAERARVRRLIGLTGQYASVDDLLTGEENLVQLGRLLDLGRAGARARAGELLERFALTDAARRRVATYSGGMRRRLDLAASLLARPAVLFLDEPTTGLDPRSRKELWAVTRELAADGTTILLTTQYLEEADQLADRIGVLHHGHIVVEGTPRQLKADLGSKRLTVTVDPAATDRAVRALGVEGLLADATSGRVTVPLDDAAAIGHVFDRLTAADVVVRDVEVDAPTLDDVFLTLTAQTATGLVSDPTQPDVISDPTQPDVVSDPTQPGAAA